MAVGCRVTMAIDRTDELKAFVKAIRLRLRAQKRAGGSLNESLFNKGPERKSSPFAVSAKKAVSCVCCFFT